MVSSRDCSRIVPAKRQKRDGAAGLFLIWAADLSLRRRDKTRLCRCQILCEAFCHTFVRQLEESMSIGPNLFTAVRWRILIVQVASGLSEVGSKGSP
jgi:hypothetical protein